MLYRCITGTTDEYSSTSSTCENHPVKSQLGYIYTSAPSGLASYALKRCRLISNGEHFDSNNSTCEGQTVEFTLGYTLKDPTGIDPGYTMEHIAGATEPNSYSRRVEYDSTFRITKDTDSLGLSTTFVWDATKDLVLSNTDPTGLMSTTIYDDTDRPVSQYGPAPSAWFGSDRKPLTAYTSQVPRTDNSYDENIIGPAVAYHHYDTAKKSLVGAPFLHSTNIGSNAAQINQNFGSSSPDPAITDNWGMTMTGTLRLPTTGNYTFRINSDNGIRFWIDDDVVVDDWSNGAARNHPTYTYNNTTANKPLRFRIQYYHTTGTASFGIYVTPPGQSETANTAQYFSPDYSLSTSAKTYDSTIGDTTATTSYGSNPELGLTQSTALDPAGANLATSSTYETPGATGSFLRQLSSSLPGGATTTYSYYGATETADNPCTTSATEAYRQGGQAKITTDPDPDGGGSQTGITTEAIYDDAGKTVATRTNNDDWTCTTYDTRERVTQTAIPAANGAPARTLTYNYAVNGNPLVTSNTDSQGTITTVSDLLGRTKSYTDIYGNVTTTTYDALGRVSSETGPLGTQTYTHNNYNQLTNQKLDNTSVAQPHYDQYGRLDQVIYPTAQIVEGITYDNLGNASSQSFTLADNTVINDTVTYSQSAKVLTDTTDNGTSTKTWTYIYDTTGRLTTATDGTTSLAYGFGAQDAGCASGTNANSGKSSNRTSMTKNSSTTTYCYDHADRLVSSSDAKLDNAQYDSHGNTTSLGTSPVTTFHYDSSDRNTKITEGSKSTTYLRDATDRVVSRTTDSGNTTTTTRYGFTSNSDSPDVAMDTNNTVTEKYLSLPGDVQLTIRPGSTSAGHLTASMSNIHGDVLATVDADGSLTGTYSYDPFGQVLSSTSPNNTANNASYGWEGQNQKQAETAFTLNPIQMGARVYIPSLGRFLQVDPVPGGGANGYSYPTDPVNTEDLNGMWWSWKDTKKWLTNGWSLSKPKTIYHWWCGNGAWQATCFIPGVGWARAGGKGLQLGAKALRARNAANALRLSRNLAMREAKANPQAGVRIMKAGQIKDSKYGGQWEKWRYVHRGLDGSKVVVHYMRSVKTGQFKDWKFK